MDRFFFLALVFFLTISLPANAKELPKIAVWDLAPGDIRPTYAQDLTSILVSEISKLEKYEVYSQENVRTIAGWTATRMKLGCTDTKCLTALGQMDIAKLISGRIGKIGNRYAVSLSLFDTQNAKAEKAVSEFGGSEDELIGLVQQAVRKLLGEKGQSENEIEDNKDEEYLFVLDLMESIMYLNDGVVQLSGDCTPESQYGTTIWWNKAKWEEAQKKLEKWRDNRNIKIRRISEQLSIKIRQFRRMREEDVTSLDLLQAFLHPEGLDVRKNLCPYYFSRDEDHLGVFYRLMYQINVLLLELPAIITNVVDIPKIKVTIRSEKTGPAETTSHRDYNFGILQSTHSQFVFSKKQLLDIGQYLENYLDEREKIKRRLFSEIDDASLLFTHAIICNYLKNGDDDVVFSLLELHGSCRLK
jgi:hypothetical protein